MPPLTIIPIVFELPSLLRYASAVYAVVVCLSVRPSVTKWLYTE